MTDLLPEIDDKEATPFDRFAVFFAAWLFSFVTLTIIWVMNELFFYPISFYGVVFSFIALGVIAGYLDREEIFINVLIKSLHYIKNNLQ